MAKHQRKNDQRTGLGPEARERLARLLPADALDEALEGLGPEQITGPGGLITQLAGRVVNAALEAELEEHLGRPHGTPAADGNHRNGSTPKTLATELGDVEIATPRDRAGEFEPRLVAKRQSRLAGLDEKIVALYAGGLSTREISDQLAELYGTRIGRDQVSRITDSVLEDVAEWRHRPLEEIYAIVYLDALVVKVRTDRSVSKRSCYLAIGVTVEGEREVLGIWWQESEGARFWLAVLNDLHQRGVGDVLIFCVDGLTGFGEAIEAVFPGPGSRPASSTRSARACATSPTRTRGRWRGTCGRSTRPPTSRPPRRPSMPSSSAGEAATRWSSRAGARAGRTSPPSSRCRPTCARSSTRPTRSRT